MKFETIHEELTDTLIARITRTLARGGALIEATLSKRFTAARDGFSINAAVGCEARERGKLERVCRYMARPPITESGSQFTGATLRA